MKLYLAYKKQFNIIILFILVFVPVFFILAQTAEEVQSKISQKNSDIEKLKQEIKSYQSQLDELSKQKSSLRGSIKALDLTRKKLVADIGVTGKKIEKTNLKITGLSKDINIKQNSISNNIEAISEGIKQANEFENKSIVENILSSEDFSLVWNDIDNTMRLREKIR